MVTKLAIVCVVVAVAVYAQESCDVEFADECNQFTELLDALKTKVQHQQDVLQAVLDDNAQLDKDFKGLKDAHESLMEQKNTQKGKLEICLSEKEDIVIGSGF